MILFFIIWFVAAVVATIILSKFCDEFCFESFVLGTLYGSLIGLLIGLITCGTLTLAFDKNDGYEIESQSTYNLVRQNFDNKEYFVKESTGYGIYYEFEYTVAETGKRIDTNENVIIKYSSLDKPNVVVEHYKPNGFLTFFTLAREKDYYYITLNNNNNLYMTLE